MRQVTEKVNHPIPSSNEMSQYLVMKVSSRIEILAQEIELMMNIYIG